MIWPQHKYWVGSPDFKIGQYERLPLYRAWFKYPHTFFSDCRWAWRNTQIALIRCKRLPLWKPWA